ncbi:hypothetical protein ABPG74_001823 [Tetrahymena malaccensis]
MRRKELGNTQQNECKYLLIQKVNKQLYVRTQYLQFESRLDQENLNKIQKISIYLLTILIYLLSNSSKKITQLNKQANKKEIKQKSKYRQNNTQELSPINTNQTFNSLILSFRGSTFRIDFFEMFMIAKVNKACLLINKAVFLSSKAKQQSINRFVANKITSYTFKHMVLIREQIQLQNYLPTHLQNRSKS